MGKTKIKVIDDSAPQTEEPKKERKKVLGANIERDQKLKKTSKVEVARGDAEERSQASTAATASSEDAPEIPKRQDPKLQEVAKGKQPSELKQKKKSPPKSKKVRSKKYQQALEKVDRGKFYPIDEATQLVKEVSYSKFDGTLEIHINTSVKNVRGLVNLPFASGKKLKIMVFGPSTSTSAVSSVPNGSGQVKELEEQGVIVGDDKLLEEISQGKVNFDALVTTPDWMPKLAKVAKVLGPKGLMPNPKNGTITDDLKKTVSELQGGKTNYKTESKANIIHLGVGKVSQPKEELSQNIKVLLSSIGKTKIKKASLSPTMGPGIKLDLSSL